jgi:hypothetical protein
MVVAKSLFYFVLAGLCEIGGGYLVWLWLRKIKAFGLLLLGPLCSFFTALSNIPTGALWKSLCCIWWDFHCYGYAVGLADRQDTTGQVRHDRRTDRAYRCLHYYVLAPNLTSICERRPSNELRYLKTLRFFRLSQKLQIRLQQMKGF